MRERTGTEAEAKRLGDRSSQGGRLKPAQEVILQEGEALQSAREGATTVKPFLESWAGSNAGQDLEVGQKGRVRQALLLQEVGPSLRKRRGERGEGSVRSCGRGTVRWVYSNARGSACQRICVTWSRKCSWTSSPLFEYGWSTTVSSRSDIALDRWTSCSFKAFAAGAAGSGVI